MGRNKFISKKFFMTSVAGFVLSALSVLFLPFVSTGTDDTLTGAGIVCGIVFWAGLVTGTVCFILSWYSVRRDAGYEKIRAAEKPGYMSFFRNSYAVAADIVFVAALIVAVTGNIVTAMADTVTVLAMFLALLAFCLHFLLNGRVYRYLSTDKKEGERE